MKILHTSDWHLGRTLYGRKRYSEFTLFLDWLYATIETESIDILLICGDIFDTNTPSNKAQELYYQFLYKVSLSTCKHVVIIAGNHDSPSFLEAPKNLLHVLNVHVVGTIDIANLEKELIVLEQNTIPQAIICAIPYLRDKEIRLVESGEDIDQKNTKLIAGIQNHYAQVSKLAEQKQAELYKSTGTKIPIIATGHLFAAGSVTMSDDGVRDLYVGSLVHVGTDTFPKYLDYVALGHLHIAQRVGGNEFIRFSGSPIPMGFGEATQNKKILILTINDTKNNDDETHDHEIKELGEIGGITEKEITEITVPCFQSLIRISGTLQKILAEIETLKSTHDGAWLEIEYTGDEIAENLRESIEEAIISTKMEIRRIRNMRVTEQVLHAINAGENLSDLNESEVFQRCLEAFNVPSEERDLLNSAYSEILQQLHEKDKNAE